MNQVVTFLSSFFYWIHLIGFFYWLLKFSSVVTDLNGVLILKSNLSVFLLLQFCFHLSFIIQWIAKLQGNPYRKLYEDLNPLATSFYLLSYFFVLLVFVLLVAFILGRPSMKVEESFLRATGFKCAQYCVIVFVAQLCLNDELSEWKEIRIIHEKKTEYLHIKDKLTPRPTDSADCVNNQKEIFADNFSFPQDTTHEVKIMGVGQYHGGEVEGDAEKTEWYAFKTTVC